MPPSPTQPMPTRSAAARPAAPQASARRMPPGPVRPAAIPFTRSRRATRTWLTAVAALAVPFPPAGSAGTAPVAGPEAVGPETAQVVDVRAEGSYATVSAWQRSGNRWTVAFTTTRARVGANGVVDGGSREQGTSTTPSGTYPLTRAFGVGADPGTALPYRQVTADDWWVEDPDSRYYNQLRGCLAGRFPAHRIG